MSSLRCTTADELARRKLLLRRSAWTLVALAAIGALAWKAVTAPDGVTDPTAADTHLAHGAVVVNSALLVFREGLEAVLVLAAFTASFTGARSGLRRPVAGGAALALAASVVTWFVAIGIIGALGGPGLDVQAATGLLAVAVLLVVMNWFFHKIYWTGWISAHHNRRRRELLGRPGQRVRCSDWCCSASPRSTARASRSSSSCRACGSRPATARCSRASRSGSLFTVAVGVLTFALQRRLPYRRMLVATGVLLGFVLLVMVGESVQEMQLAGWLPTHTFGYVPRLRRAVVRGLPDRRGDPCAGCSPRLLVIGSYFVAEHVRVRRPKRREFRVAATATD